MNTLKERVLGTVYLRCDCLCSTVVVDKFKWDHNEDVNYNIGFCDSATAWGINTLKQRIRAAWHVLTRKNIYHADVWIEGEDKMQDFVRQLNELVETK